MLIITGTIAYDYIMDFPGNFGDHILQNKIHKINLSFIVDKFTKHRGGTAGNVSYSLGLLKTPHLLFSVAGNDFAEYKLVFEKIGINLSGVSIDESNKSSTGFAMTDRKDNQIWGYFYGASENIKNLKLKTVADKTDLVLVGPSGAEGSMSMVNQCIENNIDYMFDPGFILTQISDSDLRRGIIHATYVIGNDYEISLIKKRARLADKIWNTKIVITTLGDKGAVIKQGHKTYEIKPVILSSVEDPTGAGDAWRAGFLAGVTRGMDMKTCGQMGSVAASFALEAYGTQEHNYSEKEFTTRYRQAFGSVLII